jgi:hypothetical protein
MLQQQLDALATAGQLLAEVAQACVVIVRFSYRIPQHTSKAAAFLSTPVRPQKKYADENNSAISEETKDPPPPQPKRAVPAGVR